MLSLLRAIVSHSPTRRAFVAPLSGDAIATQLRPYSIRSSLIDVATREGELRVFLVAGEVSGDIIASRLMQGLKDLSPVPVKFSGVGGESMKKRGFESIFPMEELAVMGLWELLPHIVNIMVWAFLPNERILTSCNKISTSYMQLTNQCLNEKSLDKFCKLYVHNLRSFPQCHNIRVACQNLILYSSYADNGIKWFWLICFDQTEIYFGSVVCLKIVEAQISVYGSGNWKPNN